MFSVRIIAVCVAVALICTSIRNIRPEIATVISLTAGIAVLFLLWREVRLNDEWINDIIGILNDSGIVYINLIKGIGIAIVAELGIQVCEDAGEQALAGRISLASRISMFSLCGPMFFEITETIRNIIV